MERTIDLTEKEREVWRIMGMFSQLSDDARYYTGKFIEHYYNQEHKTETGGGKIVKFPAAI